MSSEKQNEVSHISWADRGHSALVELLRRHDETSTRLFSSLGDPNILHDLNREEAAIRDRIFQIGLNLAETCQPHDHTEAVACFGAMKAHMEAWGVDIAPCDRILQKALGNSVEFNSLTF